jgi:uncharacterized membrane protein (DUF485 family)
MPTSDARALNPNEHARLAAHVMRRQAGLSLRVAFVFLSLVFGLPLLNYFAPQLANYRLGGFTATWLFLGVVFYPITVALSFYFVRHSDRIESECKDWRGILDAEDRTS